MTYMIVVQGTKMIPRIGQITESKARSQRTGLTIHQITPAKRGPNNTRVVKKTAHISDFPLDFCLLRAVAI